MASSKSTNIMTPVPLIRHFKLVDGMELQVNVSGSSSGRNAKVELQLKNCPRPWILHWGCTYSGNTKWFIPANHSSGTNVHKALQTPFVKSGDKYVVVIELKDPKIHAIEFVLKDGRQDKWLKLNQGNFQIKIPETDTSTSVPPIPKDLIEHKAFLTWEGRGRPVSSPLQQKHDYDNALRELQCLLSKGMSLEELQNSVQSANITVRDINIEQVRSQTSQSVRSRHDVGQWLHKCSKGHSKNTTSPSSALIDMAESSMGGDNVIQRQSYRVGNYEIVVFLKAVRDDYHILVAGNTKGTTVLHWGVSKLSPREWLAPPPEMLPEKSKLLDAACQTYFTDKSTEQGFFQFVDINLQRRKFVGIQFVIWSGGSWINNNGTNFFVALNPLNSSVKVQRDGVGIIKWLLDEISNREKEAEKSLMHSEISEAQDGFTNLLQRIYLDQPNDREIVRLIMGCVGRGGQGHVGQRIRDEILFLQRNNGCMGGMMEEWHQKLHNNSSPDDVVICEALINYVKCDFKIDVYWKTLREKGLTKQILASYDRPILSEPHFRIDTKEGLIRDLTSYLKTLKAVHSGSDIESAIETCLGTNSVSGLSRKLQDCLHFIKAHIGDKNIGPLMEKLLESRIELHPMLLTSHGRLKDLLFLDLALDSAVRTTIERGYKDLSFAHLPEIIFYTSLVLENLCLSTVNNEDLIYCAKIDIFTEELVRSGSAGSLSMLVNRLDPILRKVANLGSWQIISPEDVCGFVVTVNELIKIQNNVYKKPTVIIANKVTGEEEIPDGAVAVLTSDMPDVLAHVSIRARNSKVLFASCFDQNILKDLKLKEGKAVSIRLKSTNLIITEISSSDLSLNSLISSSTPQGVTFKKKTFSGKYAVSAEEFTSEMVGAKSCNIKFLCGRVPSWIKLPVSVALPFGVFENILSEDINKDLAKKVSCFRKLVDSGDLSKLRAIQETVLQMKAPPRLTFELKSKMKSSRMLWPGDEGEATWNRAWQSIKKVWASKWNERAYISCRKASLNHDNLCMAVLIQEIINADYAFVIHTKNPLSGDTTEIYTEIVKGLGETLVGAYPGRAMSFITKKNNLKSPTVIGYPSKQIGLYIKRSIIFRSDSNGEDLKGFAGAGLYDSVSMDKEEEVVLDYSNDRMIVDKAYQIWLFSKIAEAGKIIEGLYGCPQDIEGVVKDGEIFVVQSRPQI